MKNFGVAGGKEQTRVKVFLGQMRLLPFLLCFYLRFRNSVVTIAWVEHNNIRQIIIIINYADTFFFWGKFNYFTRKLSTSIK